MSGVDLLPCPICGDQPLRNGRGKVGGVLCTGISTPRLAHRVQTYGATQAEADEAWNTRRARLSPAPGEESRSTCIAPGATQGDTP